MDFNLHIHVEDIKILFRFANDPEPFLGAVDHVLQIEFRDSRRMKPLREEWAQAGRLRGSGGRVAHLESRGRRLSQARLRQLLEILNPRGLARIAGIKILQQGAEIRIADNRAKHVKHHRAFVHDHRLIFLGSGLQPPGIGDRSGIVEHQRAHRIILERLVQPILAQSLLDVQSLGVAREAIRDPNVGGRSGRDLRAPPLMRRKIRQQAFVGLCRPLPRAHEQQARRSESIDSAVRELRNGQSRFRQSAKCIVVEIEDVRDRIRISRRRVCRLGGRVDGIRRAFRALRA